MRALAVAVLLGVATAANAAPLWTAAVPDSGRFTFLFGGQPAGGETFAVRRAADGGVTAEATGAIAIGGAFTLADTTTFAYGPDLAPRQTSVRATVNGTRAHSRVEFASGRALVWAQADSAGAAPDTVTYPPDAVLVPNNCFVGFQLVYLAALQRGVREHDVTMPVFGSSTVSLTRGVEERHGALRAWRHQLDLAHTVGGTLWADASGRVLKVALPLQNAQLTRDGVDGVAALGDTAHAAPEPAVPTTRADGRWSEEVRLVSAGTPLGGTLLMPERHPAHPLPAVLLLTGSGAQDRNEDSPGPGGIHFGIFRTLAERLAARGVATLRLDDRGVGASGGDFNTSTFSDEVADVRTALRFLRGRTDIDARRVAILGHSEGAMLAMLLASEDTALAAIALMAGPIQRFRDVIMAQTLDAARKQGATPQQLAETARAESAFIAVLERRGEWTADAVPPAARAFATRRRWLEELVALDLVPHVKAIQCAVGIFQGGRDDQVAPRDAVTIDSLLAASGRAPHRLFRYPTLNHLFIPSRGGGIAEYADTRATLDPTFVRDITGWLARTLHAAPPHAKRRR